MSKQYVQLHSPVICDSSNPSARRVFLISLPTMFLLVSAIWFNPRARFLSLAGLRERRDISGWANPDLDASNKSAALASRIMDCLEIKRPAREYTAHARWSGVKHWRIPPPFLAKNKNLVSYSNHELIFLFIREGSNYKNRKILHPISVL